MLISYFPYKITIESDRNNAERLYGNRQKQWAASLRESAETAEAVSLQKSAVTAEAASLRKSAETAEAASL